MTTNTDLVRAVSEEIERNLINWTMAERPAQMAAVISRHMTESDLYRAGVAACVEKVKAARGEWKERSNLYERGDEMFAYLTARIAAASQLIPELESITDSAPSPAQEQEDEKERRLEREREIYQAMFTDSNVGDD